MASQKENNSLATKLKSMKYNNLTDKEFKIVFVKKFNKLQENPRQFHEIRKKLINRSSL